MDFPILDLMDPGAYYQFLVRTLHPGGLRCPRCGRADRQGGHDRHRPPVLDYRCRCGAVFNAYTATPLQKTHRTPPQLVLILRGIWPGLPTARLARELGCDRKHLLTLRHRLRALAEAASGATGAVPGAEAEKGFRTRTLADPPRRRASKRRGHGNVANDRPPVVGVVSHRTGEVALGWSRGPTRRP